MTNILYKENSTNLINKKTNRGFTLIEAVVGIAIFGMLTVGVLGVFSALSQSVKASRVKIMLSSTAASYLEIVRNLPYSQIGTLNGNPSGSLPDLANAQTVTIGGVQYKIFYEVTYTDNAADGTITAGSDTAPNDYKQVKMFMQNSQNGVNTTFITNVSPKGLEGISNAGALSISVIDAAGEPVPNANVTISNTALNPDILLNRVTDAQGKWIEVGLPNSANNYNIVVTKSGYSTEQTYASSGSLPNPVKPNATITTGTVTSASFAIDLPANLTINTQNTTCQAVNGINVNIKGAKKIGTSPDTFKYNQNHTSASGQVALTNLEWDTYTPTLLTGQSVMVYGSSPIQQISVLPEASQVFTLILGPSTTNSLLVIVKDSSSTQPLEGASVRLRKTSGSPTVDSTQTTGGSVWRQASWTGGSGQATYTDTTKFWAKTNTIDTTTTPTGVRLTRSGSVYATSGNLESSTFDSGTEETDYTTLTWAPTSQSASTTLRFQVATNNDNATWNYLGPDGTAATYYTVSGTSVNSIHDNNRYIRYKAYLSTTNTAFTPVFTSINMNYVSGCFTPGQTIFTGLTAASGYRIDVSLAGYTTKSVTSLNISGNQTLEVLLSP